MTVSDNKLLLVDDSPEDIQILLAELDDVAKISAEISAVDALDKLKENKPDLILLDVNMPKMSGYEFCEAVKNNEETSDIDIIFISANDDTDEIIKGLELGAIDYIIKPYNPTVLNSKVRGAFDQIKSRRELSMRADNMTSMVTTMITETGSLSDIIAFQRKCFSSSTPIELANIAIETFNEMGLQATVFLKDGNIEESLSTSESICMLELDLLNRLHGHHDPFLERGNKLFAVKGGIVTLIKNMPDDEEQKGSLKDNLMIMLEGANARLEYFAQISKEKGDTVKTIANSVKQAMTSLESIQEKQGQYKKFSMAILDDMYRDVEECFFSMGLSETQEATILEILSKAVNKSLEHMEQGLELDEETKRVVIKLSKSVAKTTT